ncbi:MAG TPA: kelch repeat-containing protein, partial [Polyangiaceae bacterium]|nr:kelch repeat-containing protein [Polyangiaceae bacterium]
SNPLAYVDVLPEGAAAAPGRVRHDGAVLAVENAFPGVTSAFGADDHKVEEFLTIPSIDAVPALAYVLRDGPDFGSWVEEEGTLWAFDKQGRGLFTLAPPVVEDAAGKSVTGSWKLAPVEGGVRITPAVDWASLTFPVLFDPTFETPIWFLATRPTEPVARAGAGSAFYPLGHNCSIVFGGLGASAVARNDVNVYCNRLWQRGLTSNTPRPSERGYVAMGYVPSPQVAAAGAYVFGGFTDQGPSNEFWRLNLNGTTTRTATWTQIAPPVPITATNWPEPRYLAGLGYASNGLILFGGVGPQGQTYRDTWRYDGTAWTKVCDDCFGGRYGFAAAQLGTEAAPELVAFGGHDLETNALTNTMQRFTGSGWEVVAIDPLPAPSNGSGSNFLGDLEPPPRYVAWAARTADDNLILGSGLNLGACGGAAEYPDAWMWRRGPGGESRWAIVPWSPTLVQPGRRESASAIFDAASGDVLLFGGRTNCGTTAPGAILAGGRTYRRNPGNVSLSMRCLDTGAPGGPNGNTCERY